jgi:hypothetical protein
MYVTSIGIETITNDNQVVAQTGLGRRHVELTLAV